MAWLFQMARKINAEFSLCLRPRASIAYDNRRSMQIESSPGVIRATQSAIPVVDFFSFSGEDRIFFRRIQMKVINVGQLTWKDLPQLIREFPRGNVVVREGTHNVST